MLIPSDQLPDIARQALALRGPEQARMRRVARYIDGKHDRPYAPPRASNEYRWIMKKSVRNFLPLVVSTVSQNMHVDGYRRSTETTVETVTSEQPSPEWNAFRANRMVSRQHGVHRAVMKYGLGYVVVLPGTMTIAGEDEGQVETTIPFLRPVSPRRMTALYGDDVDDEWPMIAVEERIVRDSSVPGKQRRIVAIYDDTNRYVLSGSARGGNLTLMDDDDPLLGTSSAVSQHGLGVCPVVRFVHESDLDGEMDCIGEVEPIMLIQDQINYDTFNLMITEQYAAFRQRYMIGATGEDEQGRPNAPFNPGVDRVWWLEDPTSKFGEFEATPLAPYIESRTSGIQHMSTISQLPPYYLLGQVANLSAEALAASRDGLDRKISELQAVNTDSWRNVFRLSAKAAGDDAGWMELNGVVVWRDTSARSFAATIDGLGKVATMLGVPVEELWRRIPGVTADDVNAWLIAKNRADAMASIDAAVREARAEAAQVTPPTAAGLLVQGPPSGGGAPGVPVALPPGQAEPGGAA